MTFHYSVTYKSALTYFLNTILEDQANLNKSELIKLKTVFKLFFKYLVTSSEQLFYKHSCALLLNLPETLVIGDDLLNLGYYKSINKRKFIRHNNTRDSIVLRQVSKTTDTTSTNRAKIPNIIHNSDSIFARKIIKKTPMYIIHDEFLVPAYHMCSIIDYINTIFPTYLQNEKYVVIVNKHLFNNVYNIFIII